MSQGKHIVIAGILSTIALSGCARFQFGSDTDNAMLYYEPKPYMLVATTKECVTTATVVSVPVTPKYVKLRPGIGANNLNMTLTNGVITSIGQVNDPKMPETTTAITGMLTAAAAMGVMAADDANPAKTCAPSAVLYQVDASGNLVSPTDIKVK